MLLSPERIERINEYLQQLNEVNDEKNDIINNTYSKKGSDIKNAGGRLSQIREGKRKRNSFALGRLESTGFVFLLRIWQM